MTNEKIYQCPYARAVKCNMVDGCIDCEDFRGDERRITTFWGFKMTVIQRQWMVCLLWISFMYLFAISIPVIIAIFQELLK